MLLNQDHSFDVDYWALGCNPFELLVGEIPWSTQSKGTHNAVFIISQGIMALNIRWPWRMERNSKKLVRRLLVHDPKKRLGCINHPIHTAKSHPDCEGLDWAQIVNCKTDPGYKPPITCNLEQFNAAHEEPKRTDQI